MELGRRREVISFVPVGSIIAIYILIYKYRIDEDRENTKQKHWYFETINVYTGVEGHDMLLTLTERMGRINIYT